MEAQWNSTRSNNLTRNNRLIIVITKLEERSDTQSNDGNGIMFN